MDIFNQPFNQPFSKSSSSKAVAQKLPEVDGYNSVLKLSYIYYGTNDYNPKDFMGYIFDGNCLIQFTDTVKRINDTLIINIPYHAAHYLNYILNRLLITGFAKYVARYIDVYIFGGLDKRSGKEIKYIAKRMNRATALYQQTSKHVKLSKIYVKISKLINF